MLPTNLEPLARAGDYAAFVDELIAMVRAGQARGVLPSSPQIADFAISPHHATAYLHHADGVFVEPPDRTSFDEDCGDCDCAECGRDEDCTCSCHGDDAADDGATVHAIRWTLVRTPNMADHEPSLLLPLIDAFCFTGDRYTNDLGQRSFTLTHFDFGYRLRVLTIRTDATSCRSAAAMHSIGWQDALNRRLRVSVDTNSAPVLGYIPDLTPSHNGLYTHPCYRPRTVQGWRYVDDRPQLPPQEDDEHANPTLGFELEVAYRGYDAPSENSPSREAYWREAGEIWQPYGWLMHDGSVPGSHSAEIVSRPATYRTHRDQVIPALISTLGATADRPEDTACAGLHVHLDRNTLSHAHIARLDYWACEPRNWSFMAKLAHRPASEYCRPLHKRMSEIVQDARGYNVGEHLDGLRRRALNLSNPRTIEWRIWRSPAHLPPVLMASRILAALEWTLALVEWTRAAGGSGWQDLRHWRRFSHFVTCKAAESYPHLAAELAATGTAIHRAELLD